MGEDRAIVFASGELIASHHGPDGSGFGINRNERAFDDGHLLETQMDHVLLDFFYRHVNDIAGSQELFDILDHGDIFRRISPLEPLGRPGKIIE